MKLFLGVPSAGSPAPPFLESLANLDIPPSVTAAERAIVTGNFVPGQRELIVERALETRADVLVMCDDDMVLPKDAVARLMGTLLAGERIALAGALYYSRDGFRPMAVDGWNPSDTGSAVIPAFDRAAVDVSGVGFGCVAIRTAALHVLQPPYFSAHAYIERSAGRVRVCNEDYLFCRRLREAGWRVQLDAGVRCGHYDRATRRIMPESWESAPETNRVRMAALVDGAPRLVPADASVASIPEAHLSARLDYIIVP